MMLAAAVSSGVIILIIVLVLLIALVCGVLVIINKAKRAVNNFTSGLGVTNQLARELNTTAGMVRNALAEGMAEANEQGPKSVSAMTSMMLPKITRDFPEFEYDEQRERANLILSDYFKAINEKDSSLLTDVGRELTRNVDNILLQMKAVKKYKHYDNMHIHRTEITNYNKTAGRCVITFQSAVEYNYYVTNASGATVEGSSATKKQTKYNIDMVYVQNRELVENQADAKSMNCPNCGAPLTMLGSKQCAYCGAPVVSINLNAWVFNKIQEVAR